MKGADGFVLDGASSISADQPRPGRPRRARRSARYHQYPDGFVLFLGTMFAPVKDRDAPGQGFTHKGGDIVTIAAPEARRAPSTAMRTSDDASPGRSASAR